MVLQAEGSGYLGTIPDKGGGLEPICSGEGVGFVVRRVLEWDSIHREVVAVNPLLKKAVK